MHLSSFIWVGWGRKPGKGEGENTFILFYLEKAIGLGLGGLQADPREIPEASRWGRKPGRGEGENTFILFYLEKAMGLGSGGLQAYPRGFKLF